MQATTSGMRMINRTPFTAASSSRSMRFGAVLLPRCAPACPFVAEQQQQHPIRQLARCSITTNSSSFSKQKHTQCSGRSSSSNNSSVACAAVGRTGVAHVAFFGRGRDPDLTVLKLQVGMFGDVEGLQRQLDRIAGLLDGDDEDAMADLVQDVVVLLSRSTEYCGYAATSLFGTDDFDELEAQYNKACLKERSKFKQETFANVGGRLSTATLRETGKDVGLDRWLCVTLIMAAEATVKLPKIRGLNDLQESLATLGALPGDSIVAVELLWTPQERGDAYSKDEMTLDYPQLVNL